MTPCLPRLDVEQLQESTLFFLAEDPGTDGSLLDEIAKCFLTTEPLIEKIARHPHVDKTTLNYIRLFGTPSSVSFLERINQESLPESEVEAKRVTMVNQLRVPDKIRLALKGNKEARTLLLKDPNRLVVLAVLKSPRLTDDEVENIAKSRNMSEEALRTVARNSTWVRRYSVVEALVNNPKTPLTLSMGFLKSLRVKALVDLSKNKGISAALRTTALKMVQTKKVGAG